MGSIGSEASELGHAADVERDLDKGEAIRAAAVIPSWEPARRLSMHRATAILFGLAGVLAIAAAAAWLRGRPNSHAAQPLVPPMGGQHPAAAPPADANDPCPDAPPPDPCASRKRATGASSAAGVTSPPVTPAGAAPTPAGAAPVHSPSNAAATSATPPERAHTPSGAAATSATPTAGASPAAGTLAAPGGADKPDPAKEAKAQLAKARKAMEEGNPTAALLYCDESLALKKSARGHLARALALQGLGRLDDALAAVDRAIAMMDSYPEGWLSRGRVLEALGRGGEAKAAFARFLELQPVGKVADEIRQHLAQ
jgi:hypothetical protein